MQKQLGGLVSSVGKVLLGKELQVKLAVACMLAKGHLLIEDLPGMGKTTLAQSLAAVLGLDYERVQFTSDLLPADILGTSIFDRNTSSFEFHAGPIFTQVLLADEINRTTPKTQSALLEAMEEGQVSVEGKTRGLPDPFFVIATQNPFSQSGTYPLPESQLDRFLMRISLGYPSRESERLLFTGVNPRELLKTIKPSISLEDFKALQAQVKQVKATEQVIDYLQRLVDFSRADDTIPVGLSPRGALGLLNAAKAWAMLHNRLHLVPDDIQAVFESVVEHRLRSIHSDGDGGTLSRHLLNSIEVVER